MKDDKPPRPKRPPKWVDGNLVRFMDGKPAKIGGYDFPPPTG